jgi:dimethylargininase
MFNRAIARRPGANAGDGLTTADLGQPDIPLMLEQHARCMQALEDLGVDVLVLPPAAGFPDGCFVEDVAVIASGLAVITRPGAASRRGEAAAIEPLLAQTHALAHIEAPGSVDGGDVVLAGRRALIGLSARTNAAGARQLARALAGCGIDAREVPVVAGLHLKSSVNWLGGDRLLLTAAFAELDQLTGFDHVLVAEGEDYAANCVAHGDQLLFPEGFPRTRERLADLGYTIRELPLSEFRKMDGGLSCLSLRFSQ